MMCHVERKGHVEVGRSYGLEVLCTVKAASHAMGRGGVNTQLRAWCVHAREGAAHLVLRTLKGGFGVAHGREALVAHTEERPCYSAFLCWCTLKGGLVGAR